MNLLNSKNKCEKNGKFPKISSINSPIYEFYNDSTIFITGATGFVGKVLIQKLLSTFKMKKIYVLIRVKENKNIFERLEYFFKETIFDNIRKNNPELFKKVHPMYVDYSAYDLALSNEDKNILIENVEIVFNVCASVKFNEKLSIAIGINVLGTKKILDLVIKMKHLKSFVHISTLYCNCNRKLIKEQVYEPDIGYQKIVQLNRILDDITMEKLRPCLMGEMPNTYTMTKKIAEHLVNHKAYFLPAGIFRAPIIISTYKEPFPGYTDNVYGPTGICTWTAKGLVRVIWGDAKLKANMVPADYCINAIISSAWDICRRHEIRRREGKEIPVYNYLFDKNNLTWGQYMHLAQKGFHEPFDNTLWYYTYTIIQSKVLYRIVAFLVHNIPGYILDLIAMAIGQKRKYSYAYKKINHILDMMSYFGLTKWKFTNQNIIELDKQLIDVERVSLEFNINTINWNEYFKSYLSGIKRYFFKENINDDKLRKNKKAYRRLHIFHILTKTTIGFTLILALVKLYFKIFKFVPKLNI